MKLRALCPGDTVALVTPASPLTADKLEFAIDLLARQGYRVRVMPHALDPGPHFAGSDADRAQDLMDAFEDSAVAAVLCTRGGYGCARLFPFLDLDRIAATRKMLIGFSDITALHAPLNRRGVPTVHGPMPLTLAYPREAWVYESFCRVLAGNLEPPAEAPKGTMVVPGMVEAEVAGGCLQVLANTVGTPEAIDAAGRILLIEDVDQSPVRIDANLTHLINSGVAGSAAGFLIGEMTRTDEHPDGGRLWREIVAERLTPFSKPMVIDYPMGHAKNMLTLPLGIRARLDADAGTFSYLESLCD